LIKKGDIPQALNYYLKSLKIKEEIQDSAGIGTTLVNLGYNYDKLGEYSKALDYYKKSLHIRKKIKDDYGVANSYNLIAALYQRMAIHPNNRHLLFKSLELFEKTLKINKKISNHTGIAESYNNIGTYYQQILNYDLALKQYKLANQIQLEINDAKGYAQSSYNIGNIYFLQKKFAEAEKFALISYRTGKSMGFPQEINDASKLLYLIEKNKGNLKKSLSYFEEHILMKDSVQNEDIRRQNLELNINYEYEKQKSADSIRNLEAQKVKDAEIETQKAQINQKRTQNIALGTGIILVLVFSSLLFKKFKQTQQQNKIIFEQKREVELKNDLIEEQHFLLEEKNKEITDSIKYAERIQGAILPPDQKWNYILPNSFVLNKPKDILSGDFYWIAENDNKIFVAAADCTGHGVPGALISIVNFNLLNKAVLERGLEKPSDILDAVNKWLTESLNQTTNESAIKDGMDISLISIDKKTGEILYAGANNPLYIFSGKKIKYKQFKDDELLEYKADKFPVGAYLNEELKSFTTKEIPAKFGDTIYLETKNKNIRTFSKTGTKERLVSLTNLEDQMEKNSNTNNSKSCFLRRRI
jgi:serine phosphatase RsbU (regulator of sigma subunit)